MHICILILPAVVISANALAAQQVYARTMVAWIIIIVLLLVVVCAQVVVLLLLLVLLLRVYIDIDIR